MATKKEIETLEKVRKEVSRQIKANTNQDSLYSRGLSREGYRGGYEQAIMDVIVFLNSGSIPSNSSWRFWDKVKDNG